MTLVVILVVAAALIVRLSVRYQSYRCGHVVGWCIHNLTETTNGP
jgi:hypothetical protein